VTRFYREKFAPCLEGIGVLVTLFFWKLSYKRGLEVVDSAFSVYNVYLMPLLVPARVPVQLSAE
jgi:hypothetical protein